MVFACGIIDLTRHTHRLRVRSEPERIKRLDYANPDASAATVVHWVGDAQVRYGATMANGADRLVEVRRTVGKRDRGAERKRGDVPAQAPGAADGRAGQHGLRSVPAEAIATAVVGGTASVLAGGKFANGAITAAFSYAFGSIAGKAAQERAMDARMQAMAAQMEDLTYAVAFEPPALPQGVVDFAAGMGDTVSFGASSRIRSLYDIDGGVNESSAAYRYGGDAGVANSLLMGAGVFRGAFVLGNTATVTRWGGEGVWYMVGEQSTSSWWLSGTRFLYPYESATTIEVATSRLSYPPGLEWIKGLFGQRVLGPGP
jgi:hypothetical protein